MAKSGEAVVRAGYVEAPSDAASASRGGSSPGRHPREL